MKIWCDVCTKQEASVFCSADEAALCEECDLRVHEANKLASKHHRFSLFQPSSSSQLPHCDICQVKKALLFCQQDRAVLCRDCDVPIHTSNELTKKHDRFLLTGAKLSLLPTIPTTKTKNLAKTDPTNKGFDQVPYFRSESLTTKRPPLSSSSQTSNAQLNFKTQATGEIALTQEVSNFGYEGGSSSSISEYLIEMLPGWKVEDLLDSSSDPAGFSKGGNDGLLLMNDDYGSRISSNNNDYYNNNASLWVPQAPTMLQQASPFNPGFCVLNGAQVAKGDSLLGRKKPSIQMMDDGFTVPQIRPQFLGFKRFRPS